VDAWAMRTRCAQSQTRFSTVRLLSVLCFWILGSDIWWSAGAVNEQHLAFVFGTSYYDPPFFGRMYGSITQKVKDV
jgi:hypothetical protein